MGFFVSYSHIAELYPEIRLALSARTLRPQYEVEDEFFKTGKMKSKPSLPRSFQFTYFRTDMVSLPQSKLNISSSFLGCSEAKF